MLREKNSKMNEDVDRENAIDLEEERKLCVFRHKVFYHLFAIEVNKRIFWIE